jgi:hypothetical protein
MRSWCWGKRSAGTELDHNRINVDIVQHPTSRHLRRKLDVLQYDSRQQHLMELDADMMRSIRYEKVGQVRCGKGVGIIIEALMHLLCHLLLGLSLPNSRIVFCDHFSSPFKVFFR